MTGKNHKRSREASLFSIKQPVPIYKVKMLMIFCTMRAAKRAAFFFLKNEAGLFKKELLSFW